MNVLIIANPAAGGRRGAALAEAIREALAPRVETVSVAMTAAAGDAERIARESDADCVVSVGGDGTAHEVVNGLGDRPAALAIYPAGTANVVARELRMPKDFPAFAALVAARRARRIDAGDVNGRRFLLGVGAGLDAAVAREVAARRGAAPGYLRWIKPAIHAVLNFNHAPIRVSVDGDVVTESSTYAVIGNCRYSAGVFPLTRRARLDDGRLDVCALHKLSAARLVWLAATVWTPQFPDRRDVVYRQGRTITFEAASDLPVPMHVDGEPAGFLPARCVVRPLAIEVIAPAAAMPR